MPNFHTKKASTLQVIFLGGPALRNARQNHSRILHAPIALLRYCVQRFSLVSVVFLHKAIVKTLGVYLLVVFGETVSYFLVADLKHVHIVTCLFVHLYFRHINN